MADQTIDLERADALLAAHAIRTLLDLAGAIEELPGATPIPPETAGRLVRIANRLEA